MFRNCFGTIRNNTALKRLRFLHVVLLRFGTIRNNTALKQFGAVITTGLSFGTIRNNTALKQKAGGSPQGGVLEPFETTQL